MPQPPTELDRRRKVYRRRRIIVFGSAAILLATAFYLPATLLAPVPEVAAATLEHSAPEPTVPQVDFPGYGAAGIGAVGYPGVLAQSGSAEPLPMASITKVVTALVILDAAPLALDDPGPSRELTAQDADFYAQQVVQDGSREPVTVGQSLSQRTMLDLMLISSANNYAQTLAVWFFGSEAEYVDAARDWLDRQSLTGTTITDPTGILPTNQSSVADLLDIAKLALESPVISQIVATQLIDVPGIGLVDNSNKLLGLEGIDGVKTGTLDEAGACLLFSAEHVVGGETITLVGVVLGGPDHATVNDTVLGLLAQAEAGFHEVSLTEAGAAFAQYETVWGDAATAVAGTAGSLVLWSDTPVTVAVEADPLRLADVGDEVGRVVFTAGERTVTVPLVLDAAIQDPGPWWRLSNPIALL